MKKHDKAFFFSDFLTKIFLGDCPYKVRIQLSSKLMAYYFTTSEFVLIACFPTVLFLSADTL